MTRSTLNRTLRRAYWILGLVLLVSIVAKLADHIPGLAGTPLERLLKDIYDYLKDMSLVLITVIAAYLTNVFQKRSQFLNALKEEWRNMVKAKSTLFTYTQLEHPTQEQYLAAFCTISESLDNMRAVYRNVGETDSLIGLYPYEQLHDMRRALATIEPKEGHKLDANMRKDARNAILESFLALREIFLEEFDLDEPAKPTLVAGRLRLKKSGANRRALRQAKRQLLLDQTANSRIPTYLKQLVVESQKKQEMRRKDMAPIVNGAASQALSPTPTPAPSASPPA